MRMAGEQAQLPRQYTGSSVMQRSGRGLVEIDAQQRLYASALQRARAERLAGLGTAELHPVAPRRLAAEMMIETDDAVHFRTREVQLVRL
jgi:hypothetical protein